MTRRLILPTLLVSYALLAVVYAFSNPLFEAPDESLHYAFVDHLASGGDLPDQRQPGRWAQEGSQPPLFYALMGAWVAPFQYTNVDLHEALRPNVHAYLGDTLLVHQRNRNRVVHDGPTPPYNGLTAAVYAARLLNIGFGVAALWCVDRAARVFLPESLALAAVALGAFNPQFLFISAAVNNDILTAALGSAILWQTLVMLRDGFSLGRSATLAVLVALVSLTKISGLLFGVVVGLAACWVVYRRRDWRGFMALALCGVVGWAGIAGWWYARNLTLYGEITGTAQMVAVVGSRPAPPLPELLRELTSLSNSFWGVFGWFNIPAPSLYYFIIDLLTMAAAVGVVVYLRRRTTPPSNRLMLALLIGVAIGGLIALVAWTLRTHGTQGRLLFPYIAAWNILWVVGLNALRVPLRPLMVGLAACAVVFPVALIAPAYAVAAPLEALPAAATPASIRWGSAVELVGYAIGETTARQGDFVEVTLYWRPRRQTERPLSLYVHLVGPGGIVGQTDTYPGGGMRTTTQWQRGLIYPDTYRIRISQPIPTGIHPLRLEAGWYRSWEQTRLTAYGSSGEVVSGLSLTIGELVGE